jgi:hypothetical protein
LAVSFTRYTPADPKQRYRERMGRTAVLMDEVRRQEKPSVSMEGGTTGPAPKSEAKRNQALREMAQGRKCLLRVFDLCTGDTAMTVACHSNWSEHGKAGARKADDTYMVWGCGACHRWLDQGPAKAEVKRARFTLAHMDQVIEWRRVASDPGEPVRFRKAAQWALDELNARAA